VYIENYRFDRMKNYFRILELEIDKAYLKNFNTEIGDIKDCKNPYTSVLIGANGTRKSIILRTIVEIFRELNYTKIKPSKPKRLVTGNYRIKYVINNSTYEVLNFPRESMDFKYGAVPPKGKQIHILQIIKNGDKTIPVIELDLPSMILASTIMITDRFPIIKDVKEFPNYKYLGIRNERSPMSAGTRQYIRKTVDFLVTSISKENFQKNLGDVLDFLNFDKYIRIEYVPKYRTRFFNKGLTVDLFIEMFKDWKKTFPDRENEPWGKEYFEKIKVNKNLIGQIVNLLNTIKLDEYGIGGRYFYYEIFYDDSITSVFPLIEHLSKLDLISYPNIILKKKGVKIGISDSSSGELQLILSFIALMANMEENSLVLIDEPEISLHPNWQMKYIYMLKSIFAKSFSSCHFVIASHSHFIVSDLDNDSSSIIGLKNNKENGNIIEANYIENTYGWSAEEVLYKVFDVRTTRNYYLENDLVNLVNIINRDTKDWNNLESILKKLEKLKISYNDPLKIIMEKGYNYLSNRND